MAKFTDSITIRIKAGDGGAGGLSFRREKFIEKGGPDGGDGGHGGNVYIQPDRRYYNLSHYFKDRVYRAGRGGSGMSRNMHGSDGEDLVIPVPPGTQVYNVETGELMADLCTEGEMFCAAEGGIGGKGNAFFKSATHQTPRMAQPGMPGQELAVRLDLKLIADIGLVGLPNAGKSTLLSMLTEAKPKIADYPFTTLIPNLGVLETGDRAVFIADIPGIIEGAHKGHGLGLSFLQHIERVKAILYMIDITEEDPVYVYNLLKDELRSYNRDLPERPAYILLTKTDLVNQEELESKAGLFKEKNVLTISSIGGYNMDKLVSVITSLGQK